ncbi:hypothetical protein TIFTF001_029896 [Ficus carica]|uniref:Uncharacterized protein n=1 Tax=Ficus carica TaxID=3494 RepID=A0AA88DS95_FICCA|nr:hypothetical protein TIFTF001_029896 [Ficus carica]
MRKLRIWDLEELWNKNWSFRALKASDKASQSRGLQGRVPHWPCRRSRPRGLCGHATHGGRPHARPLGREACAATQARSAATPPKSATALLYAPMPPWPCLQARGPT